MGPNLTRKLFQKFDRFLDFFLQKINVLRFKIVSNGKILKNFDEITQKTPHRLVFKIFRNFLKI